MASTVPVLVEPKTLHMFKVNGGPPWVIASDPVDAIQVLAVDEHGCDYVYRSRDIQQMPDDEPFTMTYDDAPDDLPRDCQHPFDEEDGGTWCDECGADRNSVTMTCAEWCAIGDKHRDPVIWEFQG